MSADGEDEVMRTLFGAAARPPMGDEAFVRQIMARVERAKELEAARRHGMTVGLVALGGALLWPFRDPLQLSIRGALEQATLGLPNVSAGAAALLVAALISSAAWLYAERG